MKRYFCDICKSEGEKEDIAEVLAISDHEEVESWGDWCQNCRDRLSKARKKWMREVKKL